MKFSLGSLLGLGSLVLQPACTPQQVKDVTNILVPIIDVVTTILTNAMDAESKTGLVEKLFHGYMVDHPDPVLLARGDSLIAHAKADIQVAIDVAHAARSGKGAVDPVAAFGQFLVDWKEMEDLFGPMGFMQLPGKGFASRIGVTVVDRPFAFELIQETHTP